jgi:hypothetical protein
VWQEALVVYRRLGFRTGYFAKVVGRELRTVDTQARNKVTD